MSAYLLDTNHLSPLVMLDSPVRVLIKQRLARGDKLCIAAPILAEMLFGIQQIPRAALNLVEWHQHRAGFIYYA